MSDLMLQGVLNIPPSLWVGDIKSFSPVVISQLEAEIFDVPSILGSLIDYGHRKAPERFAMAGWILLPPKLLKTWRAVRMWLSEIAHPAPWSFTLPSACKAPTLHLAEKWMLAALTNIVQVPNCLHQLPR